LKDKKNTFMLIGRLVNCHGEEWKTIDISHSINPSVCKDSMKGVRAGIGEGFCYGCITIFLAGE